MKAKLASAALRAAGEAQVRSETATALHNCSGGAREARGRPIDPVGGGEQVGRATLQGSNFIQWQRGSHYAQDKTRHETDGHSSYLLCMAGASSALMRSVRAPTAAKLLRNPRREGERPLCMAQQASSGWPTDCRRDAVAAARARQRANTREENTLDPSMRCADANRIESRAQLGALVLRLPV